MDRRDVTLQNRENALEERENNLLEKQKKIQEAAEEMENIKKEQLEELEKISKFTKEQAREAIMKTVEEKMGKEIAAYVKERISFYKQQRNAPVTQVVSGADEIKKYKELLIDSKLVLWNGPLGMYEDEEYQKGTYEIMKYLYNQSVPTILAGGDITGASKKFKLDLYYVSTGGGSTLEYLEGRRFKTLERLNGEKK